MADAREPPPMDDDEDIFGDSQPKLATLPASNPFEVPDEGKTEEKKSEEKTRIPVDINIDSDKDDEDIFGENTSEVKLDSDNDDPDEEEQEEEEVKIKDHPAVMRHHEDEPVPEIRPISAAEERPKLDVTQTMSTAGGAQAKVTSRTSSKGSNDDKIEEDPYTIDITVVEPHKVGDGMGAYVVYKVITKTTIPAFRKNELIVVRRFSDFLGLYEKLREKHAHYGRIVPPAPEKSLVGMTKVKMSKEESGSADFLERRRAALERYLNRTAAHPQLRMDPDFRDFLERDGELPKATNTSALSGAGVKRLLNKIGDSVEKITFKMDESDEWFEEKTQQIENLETQLRKLHTAMESLVNHRRELSLSTATFAKSAAMLGASEEHTALSRALSHLAETEEKIEQLHKEQSEQDFYIMTELLKDYLALLGAVKEALHERVKAFKNWKDAEATLTKKREVKAKLELAQKTDKISAATQEITDWVQRVEKGQRDFDSISATMRKEIARFDKARVTDFKTSVIQYLQSLMEKQQQMIKHWEHFLPEAKAIA
ncbi:sorting nexin-2-like isoform X4 [Dreissena polymorpha]|uniref:sorting nexin-2-like isoform X2 n=1 Tax=Dreissena polymorpha TaxID=45954 RepID=UPI00226561E4|nr:sorting nexin-2-like isoform X2 [Dreissena polymorpha]XP_052270579.1 sorting nexin-2-like isoform X3 [Dreissena polymorpha]XP_052270580.1 sorting nexin-2-like isoform X4 [Dreissena polymorpha]